MLVKIPLLSFLIFGFTYPQFLWLIAKDPIKHNFHRFHLACPVVIAGIAIIGLWLLPGTEPLRIAGGAWLLSALIVTALFWNKETSNPWVVTLLCLAGIKFFITVYVHLIANDFSQIFIYILSGLIVSGIFYAMNLGHFYLNVHGLKIFHLKNSVVAFGILLVLRLLWDIVVISSHQVMFEGQEQSIFGFMNSMEGFMLWIALFFGTIFPLGALYFVSGTLKLKNTQATTGILYVLLSAILLGDLTYKYYLLKFGIAL